MLPVLQQEHLGRAASNRMHFPASTDLRMMLHMKLQTLLASSCGGGAAMCLRHDASAQRHAGDAWRTLRVHEEAYAAQHDSVANAVQSSWFRCWSASRKSQP